MALQGVNIVVTPEQDIHILLQSRVQAVVLVRVVERLIQSQPLVIMGGNMRLLHVDVRCIMKLYMPIVGKKLVEHQAVDVVNTNSAVMATNSGMQLPVRLLVVTLVCARVVAGVVALQVITRRITGEVRLVAVNIMPHVKTPLVDIIVVGQQLMVVKYTALVMAQVLPQPQLIPSVQHRALSIV